MESGEKLPQLFFNGDATFSMPCPLTDLRKLAPKWSLAGDAQLLGFMQNFSNKLIAQTKDIQKQLNSLTYKTKTMDVKLNNVFNDFNMLANTQFVENRVYDEDSCILQQPVEEQPKKLEMTEKERDAEMMMMMNEAVRLCKKALDCPSDPVRKDRYAARTLPTLLNRQQTPQVEDRTRAKSANQVESSSDNPPKPEEADKLSQTSDASEARRPSSSLESSLKTESLQGRKESTKDIFADDNEDSDGDLFSRPAKVPKIVPAKSKDQLVSTLDAMFKDRTTKQEIASSSSSLASDRLAKENKGKVKSLFDESDSAEEDIFEQISNIVNKRPSTDQSTLKANNNESILPSAKKVPIGAVSVFGNSLDDRRQSLVQSQKSHLKDKEGVDTFVQPSSSSSSSLDSKSKQPNLMTKKPVGLFDDDEDDDGDLFSATNKKPTVEFNQPKPREPIKTIAEAETRDKLVQKVQKPVPVKSLFDDDDDDDDDEDIFSKLAKQSTKAVEDVRTKDVEAKFPTSAVSSLGSGVDPPKKSETPKKIRSIFDDDDDDDEEVNDMVLSVNKDDEVLPVNKDVKTTTQAIQNPTPKIKSIFDDDDDDDGPDLFQNLLKSTKKLASEAKDKLNTQSKADASETEPPEALPPGEKKNSVPSVSGIPQASKIRKSLFDDDEEDEEDDLFSSLLKTKPPPVVKKEDVLEQQPQTTTRPQKQQTATTTTISTTVKSEQQKQPTTLVTDSKESELKTSISPQKSKVKGDRISKLQNSLNIDPLSLGPFSHKKVQKELMDKIYKDDAADKDKDDKDNEDDKVDEEHGNRSKSAVVFRVGGDIDLPSADTTKNSLHDGGKNTPDNNDASTDKSDLNVGSTNTLPSLVKGRPKMIGRRRPTTRNKSFENVDDKNFSQSNANVESTEREVHSNENIPETTSRSNDFLVHQPKDLMEVPKDRIVPDDSIRRPSRLFGDVEGDESPFSESVDKTSRDSLVHRHHSTLKQDDVKDFFDTGSYIYGEKVEKNPCNFKSNDFEPPPLFSDGDDDDDEEAEDLFGNFQKGADFSENDVFNVKRGAARSKGVEDKIKEESKTTPEKNVVLAFDDEDEDDDDLFAPPKPASEPSKKPAPSVAKTTPVQVAPMFGNDDDDDDADLFSDVSLTMKSASKPELPPLNLSSSSNGPEKATTAKANVTPDDRNVAQTSSSNPAGKSIFEELEDGDLFSEESSVRVVAPTTSSNPAGKSEFNSGKSLFGDLEDEDLFEDLVSKPTKNAKGPTKAVIKQGNLFDDSDDDIFNSSTTYSLPSKGGTKAPTLRDGGVGKSSNSFGDPLSNL